MAKEPKPDDQQQEQLDPARASRFVTDAGDVHFERAEELKMPPRPRRRRPAATGR